MAIQTLSHGFWQIMTLFRVFWGFIESDTFTLAIPNTAFGIFGAFASDHLVEGYKPWLELSYSAIIHRILHVLAFNIGNIFIFTLANQRLPSSVSEDRINKPWRPIPRGSITMDQTRRLMLCAIPLVLALDYMVGGDEVICREVILAIAYGLFNSGSLLIATGLDSQLSSLGLTWIVIISGTILMTMQIQDLKDQNGDKVRNRKTIVLYFGETFSRASVASFVCFWCSVCGGFWKSGLLVTSFTTSVAFIISLRVLLFRSPESDARTWKLWCFWHASLYTLPYLSMGGLKA
ncbi:UbiA prenyltransferase family-domain-containing protein [Xylaria grammica]|nr:UbiA prenyltransferase family-domain-containing protein [Xylaria grammica]